MATPVKRPRTLVANDEAMVPHDRQPDNGMELDHEDHDEDGDDDGGSQLRSPVRRQQPDQPIAENAHDFSNIADEASRTYDCKADDAAAVDGNGCYDVVVSIEDTLAYLKLLTEPPYVNGSDPTAAQVFLYNVLANQAAVHLDRANGSRVVTTADNDAAAMNGYTVSEQLYRVARTRFDAAELPDWDEVLDDDDDEDTGEPGRDHDSALDCPMKFRPCDLGITLVMLAFGSYYSRKQYPIFVNAMKTVRELELLERFLLTAGRCGQSTARGNGGGGGVRLDANLAIDPRYGLLANRHRFQGTRYLRVDDFEAICAIARSRHSRPEEFVEALQPFDSAIVESFYMFTSVTRDAKMIAECRELSCPRFVYTFDRPQRSERYDGRFWFRLPPRSTWFAYSQKRWSFQSYLGRDSDSLMRRLDGIKALVVGYVHDRALYPVFVDHPLFVGRWLETMYCFAALGFPVVLRDDQPPDNLNTFYYVRDGDGALYRFHRPRRPAP